MTVYHVYLEEGANGECLAHVPDLPGCVVQGESREAALALLPAAVTGYITWCTDHGDPLPSAGDIEAVLVEIRHSDGPSPCKGGGPLFTADRVPLGDAELRTYLRRLDFISADLLRLLRSPPAPLLDGSHSARGALDHLMQFQVWAFSRVGRRIETPDSAGDPVSAAVDVRARMVETALRFAPRQSDYVYVPRDAAGQDEGWTLRKVLRLVMEHDMFHLHALRSEADKNSPVARQPLDPLH